MGLRLDGPTLVVTGTPGDRITVDTRTFAVRDAPVGLARPAPSAAGRRERDAGAPPWAPALLAVPPLLAGLGLLARRHRPRAAGATIERRQHVMD